MRSRRPVRIRVLPPAVVVASIAWLTLVAGMVETPAGRADAHARATVPLVSFVPVGRFPTRDATSLARYFRHRLGLRTSVWPGEALPASAFDRTRGQYVAEKLITVLHRPAGDPTVVIGLTVEDMYTRSKTSWRYTFSLRDPHGFAVVSSARMDPRAARLNPDPALRMRRLRKMVLKNIAVLAYGRAPSSNPRSVLYDSILGPDDLDYMTEELAPKPPSRARESWLRGTDAVCRRGIAEAKALIRRSRITTREEFLAFARESIDLEVRHRSELAGVAPAPEDRAGVRALLTAFARAGSADRKALAGLRAHWTDLAARRWLEAGIRVSFALKSKALELGSRTCARYFDPETYSR